MIILVFFTPFFIAIAWLYMIDMDNTEMINDYMKENSCKNIVYYKSKYKALCQNNIVSIKNQFTIDFSSNEIIKYNKIIDVKDDNISIEIKSETKKMKLDFKNEVEVKTFLNALKERKNK